MKLEISDKSKDLFNTNLSDTEIQYEHSVTVFQEDSDNTESESHTK